MTIALDTLIALGGIAHRRTLLAAGLTGYHLTKAVRAGEMFRVRQAWYATDGVPEEVVRAVRVGGRLTSFSLFEAKGVWVPTRRTLHVAVAPNAARLRSPRWRKIALDGSRDGVEVHWSSAVKRSALTDVYESLPNAVSHLIEWPNRKDVVAALDSIVRLNVMSFRSLAAVLIRSAKGRSLLAAIDPRCESGIESITRIGLVAARIRATPQVTISPAGRVDFLIGDKLVVEVDGFAFHKDPEAFENDRRRDRELTARGYRVLRFTFDQIINDWSACLRAVLAIVRAGGHRFGARERRRFERAA